MAGSATPTVSDGFHWNIKDRQTDYSTWVLQQQYSTLSSRLKNQETGGWSNDSAYPTSHWSVTQWYDWSAKP